LLIAEDMGCKINWVDIGVEDCTLNLASFEKALEKKPKIALLGMYRMGTINPVHKLVKLAHETGTLTYLDTVQHAPHGPIDVQDLDTDFLVCSAYNCFGEASSSEF